MTRSHILLLISALAAPLTASASEPLFLQVPALVDPAAPIPTAVKNQCAVETSIGAHAMAAIAKRLDPALQSVASPEQAGADKLVQITILSVQGAGGGAWSGPKSMTIRVDVQKGGVKTGSTILTRATNGGPLAGLTGTCTMLERVATTLGKDVALWLARAESAPVQSGMKAAE